MPRVSRDEAQANRTRVTQAASTMYRERGIDRVSLAEVMTAAGMTIGAFHAQFGTKEALAVEAFSHAFAEMDLQWRQRIHEQGASQKLLMEFVGYYLSVDNRDGPGSGCAFAGLASDVAHEDKSSPLRPTFLFGIKRFLQTLTELLPSYLSKRKRRQRTLALYSMLVGAITIARATRQDPISDEILSAAMSVAKELLSFDS